jgi:hypothetical protein
MPDDVQQKLEVRGLIDAYEQHPFYQRNDYLSWISRAKGSTLAENGSIRCSRSSRRVACTWAWITPQAGKRDA